MNRVIPIVALAAFLTTGCSIGPNPGEKEAPDGEAGECSKACGNFDGTDITDMMINRYLDGPMEAAFYVQLHDDPESGQYWTSSYKTEAAGATLDTWQVVGIKDDIAIIEQRSQLKGEHAGYDYVVAYEVVLKPGDGNDETKSPESVPDTDEDETGDDPGEADEDEEQEFTPNVKRAWIGRPGKEPQKIEVGEAPNLGGRANEKIADVETADFEDLELAGGTWSGTRQTVEMAGVKVQTWIADNGWFTGVIRIKSDTFMLELTKFGTDGAAFLKWPEEEAPTTGDGKDDGEGETE